MRDELKRIQLIAESGSWSLMNRPLPFDSAELHAMLLAHAWRGQVMLQGRRDADRIWFLLRSSDSVGQVVTLNRRISYIEVHGAVMQATNRQLFAILGFDTLRFYNRGVTLLG